MIQRGSARWTPNALPGPPGASLAGRGALPLPGGATEKE
jgi:hypothetical protein